MGTSNLKLMLAPKWKKLVILTNNIGMRNPKWSLFVGQLQNPIYF